MKVKLLPYIYFTALLFCSTIIGIAQNINLQINSIDKNEIFLKQEFTFKSTFPNEKACFSYLQTIINYLQAKGFLSASLDSITSSKNNFTAYLFVGDKYIWKYLQVNDSYWPLLDQLGIKKKLFTTEPFNPAVVTLVQEKLLDFYEANGYPFAAVQFDSLQFKDQFVTAKLIIEKGILYKMDSLRIFGNVKLKKEFLYKYLSMPPNSMYNNKKLAAINQRLLELPYLQQTQPWQLAMLGKSYILDIFANTKKSNQVDAIVGLLPNNQQINGALLFTVDAKIKLQNAFAKGETIALNWQQIQPKSPRLNITFQQPYIFNSQFGFDFSFDLFKRDSSFLNLQSSIGILYEINAQQKTKLLYQSTRTNLLDVDTLRIKLTKQLPDVIDVVTNSLVVDYDFNNTNYRFNPSKGNDLKLYLSAGSRRIIQNNTISQIKDGSFNYLSLYDSLEKNSYQIRLKLNASKYFTIGKYAVFKTALQTGLVQSPTIFRNEVFQIGGFKTLRGFDEESIFTSRFAIGTFEYRYLFGQNAFFSAFTDVAYSYNPITTISNNFIGFGLGLAFETKQGIFNINVAAGKRNDLLFELRQTKIHVGFVSLF